MKVINNLWLIDDDFLFRTCAEMMIRDEGFARNIHLVESGFKALEMLEKKNFNSVRHPELIFLDINMPVLNGWDFMDTIIERKIVNFKRTRIYILSSSIDKDDYQKANTYEQISGFIPKPLTPENIVDVIKRIDAENRARKAEKDKL